MKTSFLAVSFLALTAFAANAETSSLSGKVQNDLIGAKGGITTNPTAQFFSDSLADKVQMDLASVRTGRTADPLAQPQDYSLSSYGARTLVTTR